MYNGILMDDRTYHVRILFETLEQSFELLEGPNAGRMLSGLEERDLLGTAYSYRLAVEEDPEYPQDYDDLFWNISAPVDTHRVELPSGQGTMSFEAKVTSGTRRAAGWEGGRYHWRGLVVEFIPIHPQRPAP